METTVEIDKLEIAKWLLNLEDNETLKEIDLLMKQHIKPKFDPAYEATLSDEEKIKYWKEIGYTIDEARRMTLERMAKWGEKKKQIIN